MNVHIDESGYHHTVWEMHAGLTSSDVAWPGDEIGNHATLDDERRTGFDPIGQDQIGA